MKSDGITETFDFEKYKIEIKIPLWSTIGFGISNKMATYLIIYYFLLFIAAVLTLLPARYDKSIIWISILLFISLAEELVFEYLVLNSKNQYFIIYHIYVPVYYTLFALYFYQNILIEKVRRFIFWSIILFFLGSISWSFFNTGFSQFPGLQINVAGFLLIILSLIGLYTMDATDRTPILKRSFFWISISTLIFYSSDFIIIGLKSYLSKYDKPLATVLNQFINVGLNYLYYLLIIIGMICSRSTRKYLAHSS